MEEMILALDEVTRGYCDTRVHFCRLEAAAIEGERCLSDRCGA